MIELKFTITVTTDCACPNWIPNIKRSLERDLEEAGWGKDDPDCPIEITTNDEQPNCPIHNKQQ